MSSASVPMSARKTRTRNRLLEAAWRRLEREDPARLEDIGADVGVSRQSVYLHFGSRGGLLLALLQHIDDKMAYRERLQNALREPNPAQRLRGLLSLLGAFAFHGHGVVLALERAAETDAALRTSLADRRKQVRRALRLVFEELEAQDQLTAEFSLSEMVDLALEASSSVSYTAFVVRRGWSRERFVARLLWTVQSLLKGNEASPLASDLTPAPVGSQVSPLTFQSHMPVNERVGPETPSRGRLEGATRVDGRDGVDRRP